MRKERRLGLRQLFLIFSALSCCRSLEVSIPERQYEVARGGDITLTCSFIPAKPDARPLVLQWEATPDNKDDPMIPVANYYFDNQNPVDIAPLYEGRAFLSVDQQLSTLRLTKVTMQDNRNFQCSVIIPKDDEGTTAAITSLLVLEPPSKPICRIQGNAEYWNNISLTCMSEQGSPQPSYKWSSYNVQNIHRRLPPTASDKLGVLSLFNISRETSGFYICVSENRIGSASCNFTLTVMPPNMNLGSTAAIIGGVLAGVLCLGIVIYCCYRKKGKKDKYAQGSPGEVEFQDTPAVEEQYGEDNHSRPHIEEKDTHQNSYSDRGTAKHELEDDQHSYDSQKEKLNGQGNNANVRPDLDGQRDPYGGTRDRLDDQPNQYRSSRDDQRDRYGGSRDRLDDQRDRNRGSRDRLDDQRDYRSSRDRLDDQRDYRSSRDRLDDQRDYRSSRDRLDDQRDYRSSRDRLDYQSDR